LTGPGKGKIAFKNDVNGYDGKHQKSTDYNQTRGAASQYNIEQGLRFSSFGGCWHRSGSLKKEECAQKGVECHKDVVLL